ncbi:MAG: DUF421 domain-containing protein [Clostridia bacterium]|nr:DUF421 domain-containing protein [Clostridia bacterium]
MGKRQIGELQSGELVVTVLLSEIGALPITDPQVPLYVTFIAIGAIVAIEVITSFITLKSPFLRNVETGDAVLIIDDGRLLQDELKQMRLSIDDLCEDFRLCGVFDLSTVQYAFIEANGRLSYLLFPQYRPKEAGYEALKKEDGGLVRVIISDGHIDEKALKKIKMSDADLEKILKKEGVDAQNVFFMSADKTKRYYLIKNEKQ